MYSFFVLGLIPGTSIQITFEMWLMAAEILVAFIVIAAMLRAGSQRRLMRSVTLKVETPLATTPNRTPLPATRLHRSAVSTRRTIAVLPEDIAVGWFARLWPAPADA